jgi:hypothetical protein
MGIVLRHSDISWKRIIPLSILALISVLVPGSEFQYFKYTPRDRIVKYCDPYLVNRGLSCA